MTTPDLPAPTHLTPAAAGFLDAMARLAGGVVVLTTLDPIGRDCGLTISAVSSVSLEPPLVLATVKKDGFIHDAVYVADGWSLSFLAADQLDLARYGARARYPGDRDDFARWPSRRAARGELVFTTGVAELECTTHALVDAGDHTIIVGRVTAARSRTSSPPLIHLDRGYYAPGDALEP